jgi:hypothetical protein
VPQPVFVQSELANTWRVHRIANVRWLWEKLNSVVNGLKGNLNSQAANLSFSSTSQCWPVPDWNCPHPGWRMESGLPVTWYCLVLSEEWVREEGLHPAPSPTWKLRWVGTLAWKLCCLKMPPPLSRSSKSACKSSRACVELHGYVPLPPVPMASWYVSSLAGTPLGHSHWVICPVPSPKSEALMSGTKRCSSLSIV